MRRITLKIPMPSGQNLEMTFYSERDAKYVFDAMRRAASEYGFKPPVATVQQDVEIEL